MLTGSCHCGGATWTFDGDPGSATACNCTICRRYGTLWAYDYEGERIQIAGVTASYQRSEPGMPTLEMRFCPTCACVVCWRDLVLDDANRRRIAVNLRLTTLEAVGHLPIDHLDGLGAFEDLPRDGKCIRDLWS